MLQVLHDWNCGKLRYHTLPPEDPNMGVNSNLCTAELVDTFSKEFDLDALDEEQKVIVQGFLLSYSWIMGAGDAVAVSQVDNLTCAASVPITIPSFAPLPPSSSCPISRRFGKSVVW